MRVESDTPGDTIFVPAGTIHTVGAGVLLAEVRKNSDTTHRLHDFGRRRELHMHEAMESTHFDVNSPDTVPAQIVEDDGVVHRELLVSCRHFAAECVVATGTFTLELAPTSAPFQALHVLPARARSERSGGPRLRPRSRRATRCCCRASTTRTRSRRARASCGRWCSGRRGTFVGPDTLTGAP